MYEEREGGRRGGWGEIIGYYLFQERIRTKKKGRVCNLNWAEFLNCTKNRTSSQE